MILHYSGNTADSPITLLTDTKATEQSLYLN